MPRFAHSRLPAPIAALARRLERYRRNPRRGRNLPEELWEEAAQLAAEHGVCRIQQSLRLNYQDLKRRTEALSKDTASKAGAAFVELRVPSSTAIGGVAVLELEDGRGRKLTVRLASEDGGRFAAAVSALWNCAV